MPSLGISDLLRKVMEMGRKALLSLELSVVEHAVTGSLRQEYQWKAKPNNYPNAERSYLIKEANELIFSYIPETV